MRDRVSWFVRGASFVGVLLVAVSSDAQEEGSDAAVQSFQRAISSTEKTATRRLDSGTEHVEILDTIVQAVDLLDEPPNAEVLNAALARMRDAETMTERSSNDPALRKAIGVAVDRLKTELLNPLGTDMPKLIEDLHHGVVHGFATVNRADLADAQRGLVSILLLLDGLEEMQLKLGAVRMTAGARRMRMGMSSSAGWEEGGRLVRPYQEFLQDLVRRASRDGEVLSLIEQSVGELDTFQNAIGLTRAHERLKTAAEKVGGDPEFDPEVRRAIEVSLSRIEVALQSPSSTDMGRLREELHHTLQHPAEELQLSDILDTQEQLAVVMELAASLEETAGKLRSFIGRAVESQRRVVSKRMPRDRAR